MSRQPFNTRWAQGVETEDNLNTFKEPGGVRISQGWEGGQDKDAPPAGQENWWHNRVDTALQGIERNGVMSWHPQAVYGLGAPSYGADGNYYESTATDNVGNNPVSTVGFWRYCGPSFFSGSSPGDLKMVAHNNIPTTGWLKCNGALLLRSSYQLLFSAIGTAHNIGGETNLQFRLPDFRGEFVRGFDDGRGVNPGRVFGSGELPALENHNHYMPTSSGVAGDGYGINDSAFIKCLPNYEAISMASVTTYPNALYLSGQLVGSTGSFASETRPRNKVANYWIRY